MLKMIEVVNYNASNGYRDGQRGLITVLLYSVVLQQQEGCQLLNPVLHDESGTTQRRGGRREPLRKRQNEE